MSKIGPPTSATGYTYDADANVLTRKTRKGDTLTFTYDILNRLSTKAATGMPTVTYGYDLLGRPPQLAVRIFQLAAG